MCAEKYLNKGSQLRVVYSLLYGKTSSGQFVHSIYTYVIIFPGIHEGSYL